MSDLVEKAMKRMRREMPTANYVPEAQEELGMAGRMLSGSKHGPEGEDVFWNACVFNERHEQVWHGDFNLTRDRDKLQRLAGRIGPIYLTRESPFRFKGLKVGMAENPNAVVKVEPVSP